MCRPGIRQVLRHWENLLNTPSASITDELDPKRGQNRLLTGQIRAKSFGNRPIKNLPSLLSRLAILIVAQQGPKFNRATPIGARAVGHVPRETARQYRRALCRCPEIHICQSWQQSSCAASAVSAAGAAVVMLQCADTDRQSGAAVLS